MSRQIAAFALLFPVFLVLPHDSRAEEAWTTRSVEGLRWPDSEIVTFSLEQGTRVLVVYRAENVVRVQSDDEFGWVPEDSISTEKPRVAEDAPSGLPTSDLPTVDFQPPADTK